MTSRLFKFILGTAIVILIALYVAYLIEKNNDKKDAKYTFKNFLDDGVKPPSFDDILVGMSFGIAMGFVDTLAIWLGVDQLGKYIKGGPNLKAAVGNMYSNLVAVTVGSSVTIIMTSLVKIKNDQSPVYLNALGLYGAALGIMFSEVMFK